MWGSQSHLESNNDSMVWWTFEPGPSPILDMEHMLTGVTWSDLERHKATYGHKPILNDNKTFYASRIV